MAAARTVSNARSAVPWAYPRTIAHRGGGRLAPENTLAAIRTGAQHGFAGVEFDVMLSRDSVPVLIHDETLERTTNGRGAVADTAWMELATLDAGGWFGPGFAGEPLPRYVDAAHCCVELGLWANVEIKPAAGFERETGRVVAGMTAAVWQSSPVAPLLSSFSIEALEAAAAAAPRVARGLLVEAIPTGWQDTATRLGCVSVHCDFRHLTRPLVRSVKDAGFGLLCYTVNDPETARKLYRWGVDALVTDRIDLVRDGIVSPT